MTEQAPYATAGMTQAEELQYFLDLSNDLHGMGDKIIEMGNRLVELDAEATKLYVETKEGEEPDVSHLQAEGQKIHDERFNLSGQYNQLANWLNENYPLKLETQEAAS